MQKIKYNEKEYFFERAFTSGDPNIDKKVNLKNENGQPFHQITFSRHSNIPYDTKKVFTSGSWYEFIGCVYGDI